MTVDKQTTVRLQAKDDLSPALRAAAREADSLGTAIDKAAKHGQGLGGAWAGRAQQSLRSLGAESTRVERALNGMGAVGAGAVRRIETSVAPLRGRLDDAAKAAERATQKYEAMSRAGRGMLLAGAAMAAGIGAVAREYAQFDKAMSSVQANTGATGANLERLRQTAIDLGAATQYSGEEAAQGINELAKAGVSTTDIINGGLKGALSLAAAGQMEVGEAAETAASAMTQFGLRGADIPHIADLLAAGANAAQGSVHDLGMALNQTGLVASAAGSNIDDTVATLTAFASAGMTGSDAGTSLKTMFQRLTPQSKEAAAEMDKLGLSAFDSAGNFVGLSEYADRLQKAMAGLSPKARQAAMNIMFGADAVRGANILYREGSEGIEEFRKQIVAAGFAAQNAAALNNNLSGDLEKLGGSFNSVVLESGGSFNAFLRSVTQSATKVVDVVGAIPAPILEAGLTFGAAATAATLFGGAVLTVVPKIAATKAALKELNIAALATNSTFMTFSRAAGVAGLALGGMWAGAKVAEWVGGATTVKTSTDELSKALRDLGKGAAAGSSALTQLMSRPEWNMLGLAPKSAAEALHIFGETAKRALDPSILNRIDFLEQGRTVGEFDERIRQLDASFAQMVREGKVDEAKAGFDKLMGAVRDAGGPVDDVAAKFGEYTAAAQEAGDASSRLSREQRLAEAASLGMTTAEYNQADAAERAAKATDTFHDAIQALGTTLLAQRDAQRGFEASIDAVADSLRKNGATLDITNAKGRENSEVLDQIASSGVKAAAELYNQTGSLVDVQQQLVRTRGEFVKAATAFGMSKKDAEALAGQLDLTTDSVQNLAATLPSASGSIDIAVNQTGLTDAQLGVQKLHEQMGMPLPALQAPIMGGFLQGMATATGAAMRLEAQDPTVTVTEKGASTTQGALKKTTADAKTTGSQKPTVKVGQQGAQQTQQQLKTTSSEAKTLGRLNPIIKVGITGVAGVMASISALRRNVTSAVSGAWNFIAGHAHGGLYDSPTIRRYASGGVERHVAQIAPAGAWRVWAEEETGGEAYIPLAPTKRARSVQILEEVARRFGMAVTRQAEGGLLRFASGGTTVPVQAKVAAPTTLSVTAVVTKVVIPRNVKAPFLYTPGGPWDRSYTRPDMNTSALSKAFNDRYVSKQELTDAARANYEAQTRYAEIVGKAATKAAKAVDSSAAKIDSARARLSAAEAALDKLQRRKKAPTAKELRAARDRVTTAENALARARKAAPSAGVSLSAARTAGNVAGSAIAATNKAMVAATKARVASKTSPDDARAAAIANALSMNGRGAYKWGGGHTATYYKNSAALAADCSGFVGWAIGHALGRNVTGTARTMLSGKAGGFIRIDPKIAAKTAGAIMGNTGHVVMSLGDGRVIESYSRGKPVRIRKIASRDMKMAAWHPGLGNAVPGAAGQYATGGGGASAKDIRDAQKAANDAASAYAAALKAYKTPAYVHLAQATKTANTYSRQFLQSIRKIRDRGYPTLAFRLLQMGDEDGAVMAASLAGAPDKVLRQQRDMFEENAKLAQAEKDLVEGLGRVAGPAAWTVASKESRTDAARMQEFLNYIQTIHASQPQLAARILAMGVEDGYDVARTAAALPKGGVQLRAMRNDLVAAPDAAQARQAWTIKRFDNASWRKFLDDVETVRSRGFTTLADTLLDMGVEQGGPVAAMAAAASDYNLRGIRNNYVDEVKALSERQAAMQATMLGPQWRQQRDAMRKDTTATGTFLADIRKIRDRGFASLALRLLEMGEEDAAPLAAEAAKAADGDLSGWETSWKASEEMAKQADTLLDQLKGIGQVLNITVGAATGSEPGIRYTAPRPVDARPAPVQYLVGPQLSGPSGPVVQVDIGQMVAANPSTAGSQLEARIGDALAVSGIGRTL